MLQLSLNRILLVFLDFFERSLILFRDVALYKSLTYLLTYLLQLSQIISRHNQKTEYCKLLQWRSVLLLKLVSVGDIITLSGRQFHILTVRKPKKLLLVLSCNIFSESLNNVLLSQTSRVPLVAEYFMSHRCHYVKYSSTVDLFEYGSDGKRRSRSVSTFSHTQPKFYYSFFGFAVSRSQAITRSYVLWWWNSARVYTVHQCAVGAVL